MIPVAKPILSGAEIEGIKAVLDSGILAQGEAVAELEKRFAEYVGASHGVATNSGTSALHTALAALGVGEGDEVITTAFTFIATATSVLMQRARPVFCDIDPETYNIDPDQIQEAVTERTKAIIVVHLYGLPCDMKPIMEIAQDNGLKVVEDACQAHGAEYHDQKVGSIGDVGVFSFYPTKNMTTGEGGIITTSDPKLAEKAGMIRNHGQSQRYVHEILGYNYRMTNIAAAIGLSQLDMLDQFNDKRRENAGYYNENLEVKTPFVPVGMKHVYHQYTTEVEGRENFLKHLERHGVGYGVYYPIPAHKQPLFRDYNEMALPNTEAASERVVSIPVHPGLTEEELELVVRTVNGHE
ncbi:MAG TPA: DegT/DnrJ/EryC1/StrS family aminotransferase [Methanothrix sp.]|nr:DegT/DnrJ/EryC1/StrS family aminotransferase [Methanothrix sp.]HPJ84652.1 DegT/DnrJ/EryC1/StrS family aminotransferase [Methanothrix sp.]HPR66428.1 DegT/DnrJ/EryC1/StrS family aminotransferase [Methanothrix sp.]